MIIVNIQEIKKYHAANLIFDGLTLQIQAGEKIGLIGRNGSGKSTLLRLISGHDQVDEGMLTVQKELAIGYLPQTPAEFDKLTVYEVLAYGYQDLMACKHQMTQMEIEMSSPQMLADSAALERLLKTYSLAQERFERSGGYEMDTAIEQVATGLRIDRAVYSRSFGSLSGGEKTRIALASQLIVRPALLLLDEPTNHLDLRGMEWLEQFIQQYDGACVIVSHDRYFLDEVCSKIIELEDGTAQTFLTNYSGYVKEKEELLLQQFANFQEQQKQIKKMKETIKRLEEWGRIGDNEKFFKRAASMRKALEKLEMIKRPVLDPKTADFELTALDRSGRKAITFENVTKQFGDRVILDKAEGSLFYGEKVVLVGDNGSGKTTLFKMLLGELQPDDGQLVLGARLHIGYLAQEEKVDDKQLSVLEFFKTEGGLEEGEARNILASYLFHGTDVFKPLHLLSGGEWSRLRLALLIRKKPNLLLLDEPTNHLDVSSREALEEALENYDGTVLAISHDRYFINRLAKRVWELNEGAIHTYLGNYDDFKSKRKPYKTNENNVTVKTDHVVRDPRQLAEHTKPKHGGRVERTKEQLEQEIARLEASLLEGNMEMEQIAAMGDPAALESIWNMQEERQKQLDQLMEVWLEL